ncbi:hypothetical protein [Oceanicaulis sp.]|uniref:hypothetical protein n=1 Tax=Oceanicaulis sp. TaxID=1924941 RepID=UPI003F71EAFD
MDFFDGMKFSKNDGAMRESKRAASVDQGAQISGNLIGNYWGASAEFSAPFFIQSLSSLPLAVSIGLTARFDFERTDCDQSRP